MTREAGRMEQAVLSLLMHLKGTSGGELDVRQRHKQLQACLEEVNALLSTFAGAAFSQIILMAVYSVINASGPKDKPGASHPRSGTVEAELLSSGYRCIQLIATQLKSEIIAQDPSIYLKLVAQLTLALAGLSTIDSSKKLEWYMQEETLLGALQAMLRCCPGAPAGEDQQGPETVEGQTALHDAETSDADACDTDHSYDTDEEQYGHISSREGQLSGQEQHIELLSEKHGDDTFGLPQMWGHVKTSLVNAAGGGVIAQLVQGLLDVSTKDRNRDIRLLALSTLRQLTYTLPSPDVWRPFYPGVFGGLLKVTLGDYKQGSKVASLALSISLRLTAMIISPEANKTLLKHPAQAPQALSSGSSRAWAVFQGTVTLENASSSEDSRRQAITQSHRYEQISVPAKMQIKVDDAWAQDLLWKLRPLLPILLKAGSEAEQVRLRTAVVLGLQEMFEGGEGLLGWGGEESVAGLLASLDVLVLLRRDVVPEIGRRAGRLISRLLKRGRQAGMGFALGLKIFSRGRIAQRVQQQIRQLPAAATSIRDRELRSSLRLLRGYLELCETEEMKEAIYGHVDESVACLARAMEAEREVGMQVIDALSQIESAGSQRTDSSSAQFVRAEGSQRGRSIVLGYYREHWHNLRDQGLLNEMQTVIHLLAQIVGEHGVYQAVKYVVSRLQEGANEVRRRGSHLQTEGRTAWGLERLSLAFVLGELFLGIASRKFGEGRGNARPIATGAAVRLFLESLLLTRGGVWHLPTGQALRGSAAGPTMGDKEASSIEEAMTTSEGADMVKPVAIPVEVLGTNARVVAMLIKAIGDAFDSLTEGLMRERCLMLCLFPLVEKLGDAHPVVRQAALSTVYRLSRQERHVTVGHLLAKNLDYLVEALCQRVRQSKERKSRAFPVAPAMLEALVSHAGEKASFALIKELSGVVLAVVDHEGSQLGERYTFGMMRVLNVLVERIPVAVSPPLVDRQGMKIRRWEKEEVMRVKAKEHLRSKLIEELGIQDKVSINEAEQRTQRAEDFFRGYHDERTQQGEGGLEVDKLLSGVGEAASEKAGGVEEAEDEATREEKLVLEVVDRCTHFLSWPNLYIQHRVIAVLRSAFTKLGPHRTVLLPTIHKCWPCIMSRLHSSAKTATTWQRRPGQAREIDQSLSRVLFIELLELIATIAQLCGDFLSLKFTEEIWPLLKAYLTLSEQHARKARTLTSSTVSNISSKGLIQDHSSSSSSDGSSNRDQALLLEQSSYTDRPKPTLRLQLERQTAHELQPASAFPPAAAPPHDTLEARTDIAVLLCLLKFVSAPDCRRYSVPLVYSIGEACQHLLYRPTHQVEFALELFRGLLILDAAALWPILMVLAGWDVSRRPMQRVDWRANPPENLKDASLAAKHAKMLLAFLDEDRQVRGEELWITKR